MGDAVKLVEAAVVSSVAYLRKGQRQEFETDNQRQRICTEPRHGDIEQCPNGSSIANLEHGHEQWDDQMHTSTSPALQMRLRRVRHHLPLR